MAWLVWVESWSLSVWVRESGSLWSYPTVLFLHTAGLAFAVGMSAVNGDDADPTESQG